MIGSAEDIKLVSTDGKVHVTIIGNVDVITLGLDVGTEMGSFLDGLFDDSSNGNIEGLLIEDSLGSTDDKVLGSNEGIKLGSIDGKVLDAILGNVDVITVVVDVGTKLNCLYGSLDGFNNKKLEGLFI